MIKWESEMQSHFMHSHTFGVERHFKLFYNALWVRLHVFLTNLRIDFWICYIITLVDDLFQRTGVAVENLIPKKWAEIAYNYKLE